MTPLRVTLLAGEVRGAHPSGGAGTSTTLLALALARMGHRVDVLSFGRHTSTELDSDWAAIYDRAGVRAQFLPRELADVEPMWLARPFEVEARLREDPPDVVVAQDAGASAYCAQRARELGLGYERTLFVVFCHGTMSWLKHANRNARVREALLAATALEQASVELADAVVSPSAFLFQWMRDHGWRLPERALVVPYLTWSEATGEPPPRARTGLAGSRLERLVFFGRLNEVKGVRPFAAALNALEPELLARVELAFVGGELPLRAEAVERLLSEATRRSLRRVVFETQLEQPAAIAELSRPGTLAVIPSLGDNSPNTVYECLEHGIPFIASDVGGIPELVAPEERERVLFHPTPAGIEEALRRALRDGEVLRPVSPAHEHGHSFERWREILALPPRAPARPEARPSVGVVVVHRSSPEALERCLAALREQTERDFDAVVALASGANGLEGPERVVRSPQDSVAAARLAGASAVSGELVCFLDGDDAPEPSLLETLLRAQASSGADAVTCGVLVAPPGEQPRPHLFPGEPGALGALSNGYGRGVLVRRSLLDGLGAMPDDAADSDWTLLAELAVAGARVVSVPRPLVRTSRRPGDIESAVDALHVVQSLERCLPEHAASLVRLAAGLAAAAGSR